MIYWESYIYEENVVEVEMLKASWNKYWKGFLEQMMFEFDLKKKKYLVLSLWKKRRENEF